MIFSSRPAWDDQNCRANGCNKVRVKHQLVGEGYLVDPS